VAAHSEGHAPSDATVVFGVQQAAGKQVPGHAPSEQEAQYGHPVTDYKIRYFIYLQDFSKTNLSLKSGLSDDLTIH
jgi:hypothetical protein